MDLFTQVKQVADIHEVLRILGFQVNEQGKILCPFHAEKTPSCHIYPDNKFKCFGCGKSGSVIDLYAQIKGISIKEALKELATMYNINTENNNPTGSLPSLTIQELSKEKGFPEDFLRQTGIVLESYEYVPKLRKKVHGLIILYHNMDGTLARSRFRYAKKATDGSIWLGKKTENKNIVPLGLRWLPVMNKDEGLVIFEGETDFFTAKLYHIPALGIPGSSMVKVLTLDHVQGFNEIYVWQEPDDAGRKFAQDVPSHLKNLGYNGQVFIIHGNGIKDLNDLHKICKNEAEFMARWKEILDNAESVDLDKLEEWKPTQKKTALPRVIITWRSLYEITEETLKHLTAANNPPFLFSRAGSLVHIVEHEEKNLAKGKTIRRPVIKEVNEPALRGFMARNISYVKISGDSEVPCNPPLEVVRDILALETRRFPLLQGITQAPILRSDGSVFAEAGYDEKTSLYYYPEGSLTLPSIPENPCESDIKHCRDLLLEVFCDFPFVGQADRANALAALITPVLRELIPGPVPMGVFTKPQQGVGASLMVDVISHVATGKPAKMTSAPTGREREAEYKKLITSILLEGAEIAVLDNFDGIFDSTSFGALLTCSSWTDRVLGRTEIITLPHRTVWFLTGNNVRLAGDMPRRCYVIKIDAKTARPWLRDSETFKHPRLLEWILQMRGEILASILTLARAWILAGRPKPKFSCNLAQFERWVDVVGGILAFAGIEGFLGNLEEVYSESEQDDGWEAFLYGWYETFNEKAVTTGQIKLALEDRPAFLEVLPPEFDINDKGFTRRLGRALAKYEGKHFLSGFQIKRSSTQNRAVRWQVIKETNEFQENTNNQVNPQKMSFNEFPSALSREKKNSKESNLLFIKGGANNSFKLINSSNVVMTDEKEEDEVIEWY